MHGGATLATSDAGVTTIAFSIAAVLSHARAGSVARFQNPRVAPFGSRWSA